VSDDLQRRLTELAREPRHADFARRLSEALAGIRRDFHGEARARLETMIAEALERQLERVEARVRADAALDDLRETQGELVHALYGLLLRLVPDDGATRH
jgi:hypothetical protein